jgi:hypothetical protein
MIETNEPKPKKLIYFTLGNNNNYIKLANLCVESLRINGYDGDLLFITDLREEILKNINFQKPPIFLDIENSNLLFSSANKLKIYKYPNIHDYKKIIFCDLDILWTGSPDKIFDLIEEDYFLLSNENHLMSEAYWGGNILSNEEKKHIEVNNVLGVSAGFFGFTPKMVDHLKKIDEFLNENINLVNECLEQPFINTYVFRENIYTTKLNGLISHNGYNTDVFDGIVLHFAGGPGNFQFKYNKMQNYISKI